MTIRWTNGFVTTALSATLCAAGCAPDAETAVAVGEVQVSVDGGGACTMTCYADSDRDGVGAGPSLGSNFCTCGPGAAAVRGDCDDADALSWTNQSCYVDGDGDHWGTGSRVSRCAPLSCWGSGYANNPGDLDDRTANVHPERAEIAGDGLDNDQDGRVDETEFLYSTAGFANSATGFELHARLNDAAVYGNTTLYARVTRWALDDSATHTTTATMAVTHAAGARDVTLSLQGLTSADAGRVFGATVQWYTRLPAGPLGSPTVYLATGTASDTYYTMTSPTSTTDAADARWRIVMRALEDWDDSEKGAIHEWEPDWRTTRYGYEGTSLQWCTEFYSTMARDDLWHMNPLSEGSGDAQRENDTDDMVDWFSAYPGMHAANPSDIDLAGRAPGTWLGVDTDGDGVMNHTQMLLAWDVSAPQPAVWVVQGNATGTSGGAWLESGHGQRVDVSKYNTTHTDGTRHVMHTGRINANDMLDP